jgi:uncharacterized iron-regulated membrane protein
MSQLTIILRTIRHWHARLGALTALFFILMVVTGLALNHTSALKLNQRNVSAPWLMAWMGLRAELPSQGYRVGDQYLVTTGEKTILGNKRLVNVRSLVLGTVAWNGMVALADHNTLYLYDTQGSLVDHMSAENLPQEQLLGLGVMGDTLVLKTEKGNFTTADALHWQPITAAEAAAKNLSWAVPSALPSSMNAVLNTNFAPCVSLERVILDLHSGRLFGHYGPWLIDAVAIILLGLAISGVWMYLRVMRVSKR